MGGDGARRKTIGDNEDNVVIASRSRETLARRFIEFAAKIGAQQISSAIRRGAGEAKDFETARPQRLDKRLNVEALVNGVAGFGVIELKLQIGMCPQAPGRRTAEKCALASRRANSPVCRGSPGESRSSFTPLRAAAGRRRAAPGVLANRARPSRPCSQAIARIPAPAPIPTCGEPRARHDRTCFGN